ncbi:MAG TPA: alpha/beta hydrolase [Gammaproteobacteria bacterium]|nr:alpha/beta hydrolase [Gammaproteobacteria bacterium]
MIALICAWGLGACTGLLFHPQRELQITPAALGLEYRTVSITTEDGVRLHAWYLPAQGEIQGSILYLHGNAENISTHIANVQWLPAAGYNVLLFDYRGYGDSEGVPTLAGAHLDARAALKRLLELPDSGKTPIIVFGQSLGGAIAISMLRRSPHACAVDALIVEGAPSGYRAIAREKLASTWLTWPLQVPLAFTINDDFRPLEDIAQLKSMRKLIIGSTGDNVVPINHARALFTAAAKPKTLWEVQDLPHAATFMLPKYRHALIRWLHFEPGARSLALGCKQT